LKQLKQESGRGDVILKQGRLMHALIERARHPERVMGQLDGHASVLDPSPTITFGPGSPGPFFVRRSGARHVMPEDELKVVEDQRPLTPTPLSAAGSLGFEATAPGAALLCSFFLKQSKHARQIETKNPDSRHMGETSAS
jgi:hypothetical protein